jgi:hypothetical protein
MDEKDSKNILEIEAVILKLSKVAETIKENGSLYNTVSKKGLGTWVIETEEGRMYQYIGTSGNDVVLQRHGKNLNILRNNFNCYFHLATPTEVQRHEIFLKSKGLPKFGDEVVERYTLKDEFKHMVKAATLLAKVTTLPTSFSNTSSIYSNLKEAGALEWFNKETISVNAGEKVDGFDPLNCEFYMVTCLGDKGSKVRHSDYDTAVKEAKRIAKSNQHPAWVVGVVAKINP